MCVCVCVCVCVCCSMKIEKYIKTVSDQQCIE